MQHASSRLPSAAAPPPAPRNRSEEQKGGKKVPAFPRPAARSPSPKDPTFPAKEHAARTAQQLPPRRSLVSSLSPPSRAAAAHAQARSCQAICPPGTSRSRSVSLWTVAISWNRLELGLVLFLSLLSPLRLGCVSVTQHTPLPDRRCVAELRNGQNGRPILKRREEADRNPRMLWFWYVVE